MRFSSVFKLKETSIVLGLILAFTTWGGKHIVDRFIDSPLIEYKVKWMNETKYEKWGRDYPELKIPSCSNTDILKIKNKYYLKIDFQNLSKKHLLKNIKIAFNTGTDSSVKILGTLLISEAPALKGNSAEICEEQAVQISNLTFHPRWKYCLITVLNKKGNFEPLLALNASEQAVFLKKATISTWMVRNESILLSACLIIAIAGFIAYFIISVKNEGE